MSHPDHLPPSDQILPAGDQDCADRVDPDLLAAVDRGTVILNQSNLVAAGLRAMLDTMNTGPQSSIPDQRPPSELS